MSQHQIKIQNRIISTDTPCFIIAELSANHNQNFDIAVRTIEEMKKSGADAVKLQTYTPDTLTINCDNEYFKIKSGSLWDGKTLYDLYKEAYTPWEWQPHLKKIAEDLGLVCFSSPFDFTSVDFLEKMNVPAYKIASFEITDIPLIEYAASKGKPVIISTGMAELKDIQNAIDACKRKGNLQIALLKCTSAYPAPVEEANLLTIRDMQTRFNCIVGVSDHTEGIMVPATAVALGAKIVEKHFIIDKSLGGPDAEFSLEPAEFKNMVNAIRQTEKAIGKTTYELSEKSKKNRVFARSLFVVEDIAEGELLTEKNIRSIRPGFGMSPIYYYEVIGKKSKYTIKRGTPLTRELIS